MTWEGIEQYTGDNPQLHGCIKEIIRVALVLVIIRIGINVEEARICVPG